MSNLPVNQLPLAPLGAGDLIDRAVRLYRRHLFTLIQIAAPPVVISTIGWVMLTMAWRRAFTTSSGSSLGFYVLLGFGGAALAVAGHIFGLIVMGEAACNSSHIFCGIIQFLFEQLIRLSDRDFGPCWALQC